MISQLILDRAAAGRDPRDNPRLHAALPGLATALDPTVMRSRLETLLIAPTHQVVDCRPGTLNYRGPEGCDLRYAVRLQPRAGGPLVTATVLGRVLPPGERARQYLRTQVDPQLAGPRPSVPGPFAALTALAPDLALALHVFPLDPELPTLAAATDPATLRRALPATFPAGCSVEVIRHARDGRCVLRYTLTAGTRLYGKVYAGRVAAAQLGLLARLGPAVAPGLRVPCPLGYATAIRTLVCTEVPGHRPDLTDPAAREPAVLAAARAAAVLHGVDTVVTSARPRSLHAEIAGVSADLELLRPIWPETAVLLAAELAALRQGADRVPAQPPRFTHGDFTPAQLLIDEEAGPKPAGSGLVDTGPVGTGLVDFDAAGPAEPALDLGRYRCYLRLTLAKAGGTDSEGLAELFLAGYRDAAGLGPRDTAAWSARIALYERLSLIRVAARACAQLKTDRLRTALSLLCEEARRS